MIRVQTEANRLSDTAALFMALGGGWPVGCTTPVWRECAMAEVDRSGSCDGVALPKPQNSRAITANSV